jgi:hypothetical protein
MKPGRGRLFYSGIIWLVFVVSGGTPAIQQIPSLNNLLPDQALMPLRMHIGVNPVQGTQGSAAGEGFTHC